MELTARAALLLNKTVIEPQIILEIEGLPLFGVTDVYKVPKFDDPGLFFDMPDLYFDGTIKDEDAHSLIDLKGSSTAITQQLFQDKGVVGSVTTMTFELVDKDEILTKIVSPGVIIDDILSRKANVYLNLGKGAHPEDSFPVLAGVVDGVDAGAASIKLKVSHPDGLKRQDVMTKIQTNLANRFQYRSLYFKGVRYQAQDRVVGSVNLVLQAGGTVGAESVSIVGQYVVVTIQVGVSTASNVVSAIRNSQAAVNLMDVESLDDQSGVLQDTVGTFPLVTSTTMTLESSNGILKSSVDGTFISYVKIADEIIGFTGITGNVLTGLTRGNFDTIPRSYDVDEEVETFYRIQGTMKDLALKMMLSQSRPLAGNVPYSFVYVTSQTSVPNAIVFTGINIADKLGLTIGDLVTSSAAVLTANNFVDRKIVSIQPTVSGCYITVDGAPLVLERDTPAQISFRSKYDVWPDGLGMQIDQVDVARHEELTSFFPTGFFDYDFYLKDTVKAAEFIERELYRPSGCYGIPRTGRSSLGITLPPLAQIDTKTLDETNILNPSKLRIQRSYTENFYNSVIYKFDEDAVEDKFKAGVVQLSSLSISRVRNVKNIPMRIDSKGIRDTGETREIISTQTKRLLDRYQYGAEKVFDVQVLYKVGFNIDVGSTVIFGSEALQMTDSTIGSRKFKVRVMEVVNKRMNPATGTVSLDLLNTAYSVDAKYGVVAPASLVAAGSTSSRLQIVRSFGTTSVRFENYKWLTYIGQKVIVRAPDWSELYETTLRGFDESNPHIMVVNPALPVSPQENWIIEIPPYPDSVDPAENVLYKTIHCFFNPQVKIVSSSAPNKFRVSMVDAAKFHVNSPIEIHNSNFSDWTGQSDLKVLSVDGDEITLNRSVGFTMNSTHLIDLIGFKDGGAPYRLL